VVRTLKTPISPLQKQRSSSYPIITAMEFENPALALLEKEVSPMMPVRESVTWRPS
jgi:hypothetical protein